MFRRSFLRSLPVGLLSFFGEAKVSTATDVVYATLGDSFRVKIKNNKIIATELINGERLLCCFYDENGKFDYINGPAIVRINQGKKDFSAWAENGKFSHVVYDKKTYQVERISFEGDGMILYCDGAIFGIRLHDGFINFWLL